MNLASQTPYLEFAAYGLMLAKANGNTVQAVELAKHDLCSSYPRAELILRSAADAGTTSDPTWAGSLVDYQQVVASFVEGLRSISVFDALLPLARRVPLRSSLAVVTTTFNGSTPAQGAAKPITKLALTGGGLAPQKATAITVVSDELMRFAIAAAIDLIDRELRAGVTAATNKQFLADLASGLVPTASTGDPLTDLRAALTVVSTHGTSRPFWIVDPLRAVQLAVYPGTGNEPAFPQMTPNGGVIAGVAVVVSDQIPVDSTGPFLLVVDADQLALADETVVLRASRYGAFVMDDSPGAGAAEVVSMFQTNSVALFAERWFGSQRLRDAAVAVISGADYTVTS